LIKDKLHESIDKLNSYIISNKFTGYDPYDALKSKKLKKIPNKYLKLFCTQFFVYSPVNLRPLFEIPMSLNPKALGLLMSAYCNLYKNNFIKKNEFDIITTFLSKSLIERRSPKYKDFCWGFNFPWQDLTRYTCENVPTIVNTSFIGNGFLDLYEISKNPNYLNIARSNCEFILSNLNKTKKGNMVCFSYTPYDQYIVQNANMLGSAFLARVYSVTKDELLYEYSERSMKFSMFYQKKDGSWNYSEKSPHGIESHQIDFHQGFIIDSICNFLQYMNLNDENYIDALKKALFFYRKNQFNNNGYSKWRYPYTFPIDIHNQSQGIITFYRTYKFLKKPDLLNFSNKIANWTIDNMSDQSGFFYYQKWPFFKNRISYMRWSQAWIFLALSTLLYG